MLDIALTADAGSIDLVEPIRSEPDLQPVVWLLGLPQFLGDHWPNLAAQRSRGNSTFVVTNGGSWNRAIGRPGGYAALKLNEPFATFNQYVAWTNSLGLSDFAVFAWVYVRNVNDAAYIAQFGTLSFQVGGIASGGNLGLTDGATFVKLSDTGIGGNSWYHVGVTYRTATSSGTFYISGRPAGTFTQALSPGSGASKLGGNGSNGAGIYLDDVQIYGRQLSDAQAAFVFADSCVGNMSRLNRTPQLWFLAESTATPGTIDLVSLAVFLGPPQTSAAGGASVPVAACSSQVNLAAPAIRAGGQLDLFALAVRTMGGTAITAGAGVEFVSLIVQQHAPAFTLSSQTSLVLAALPIRGTAQDPRVQAGTGLRLPSMESQVLYAGLAVTAGGAASLTPAPIDLQVGEPRPAGGASLALAAVQLQAVLPPPIFAGLVGLPKYPGAGTFVRVGLTGVFVHNNLTGQFERQGLTGRFERKE